MAAAARNSLPAFGFLTVVEDDQHGFFGGYLVLSELGRPLEFHCSTPIFPSPAQRILYGSTLRSYVLGELIGQTLVKKAKLPVQVVLTDLEEMLSLGLDWDGVLAWVSGENKGNKGDEDGIKVDLGVEVEVGAGSPPAEASSPGMGVGSGVGGGGDFAGLPGYSRSLLKVELPVRVVLATKKESLQDIVELASGSILKFEKSCEELLHLQVGEHKIALGEAVKIGDKFGFRVSSIIMPEEHFSKVRSDRRTA